MRDEFEAYDLWKSWIDKSGLKAAKLENAAASSVPDILLAMKGIIFLQELKVQRNGSFTMPIFQWAFMNSWRHACHPWQLSYAVYDEVTEYDFIFSIFSVDQVKAQNPQPAGNKKLRVSMVGVKPLYTVKDGFEFEMYREWILDNAFKRKKAAMDAVRPQ